MITTLHTEPTRLQAQHTHQKTYQTAIPCEEGHTGKRFTISTDCVECYRLSENQLQYTCDKASIVNAMVYKRKTYETAYPCQAGHCGKRFTSSHSCVECWQAWKNRQVRTLPTLHD